MAQTKRDCEYKRFGSSELLAAIDLVTGKAFPLAGGTHKSADFIEFLKMLDAFYPEGDIIRLVLDNLAVHTSKETKAYLARYCKIEFAKAGASWKKPTLNSCKTTGKKMDMEE